MSLEIQLNSIFSIQHSLPRFHWTQRNRIAAFRCVYCGDSKKNTFKTRGYFYVKSNSFFFSCKNCGESRSLNGFLKDNFPIQHKEYRLALFADKKQAQKDEKLLVLPTEVKPLVINTKLPGNQFTVLSDLQPDHKAVAYLNSRKVPSKWYEYLGYVEDFSSFVKKTCGSKYQDRNLPQDDRLIIPLYTESGDMFGFQGRSFSTDGIRYITIKIDENHPKYFGRDLVNLDLPLFITEGPIDSMFLPNAMALCGGDISRDIFDFTEPDKIYVALDNEPRSRDTIERMKKAIDSGFKVCFWNIDTKYKDINEMVLEGGMTRQFILKHVIENSFSGARAKLQLTKWKKI